MTGLRIESQGAIGLITLSRPPHNFFDATFLRELADAIAAADDDGSLRATVLTSDQRSFCAGADFSGSTKPDPAAVYAEAIRLQARRKPLVASIRGAAIGGGMGLALIADFRVGGPRTSFHANFTRIGLSPGFGLSFTLPRLIGHQKARHLLLTSQRVQANDALRLGLLDELISDDGEVDAHALSLARQLADNSPAAISATRLLIGAEEVHSFQDAVSRELAFQQPLFASDDFVEGVRAAAERRVPVFDGEKRIDP